MSLSSQYTLSIDTIFIQKVQQAIVRAAVQIQAEPASEQYHPQRSSFAKMVLHDPAKYAPLFAQGVAGNDLITGNSPDSDILFMVNSIWNAYAGVLV